MAVSISNAFVTLFDSEVKQAYQVNVPWLVSPVNALSRAQP